MGPPPANILLQQPQKADYRTPHARVDKAMVAEIAAQLGNYKLGVMEHTALCRKMFPQAPPIRKAIFFDLNIPVGSRKMEQASYEEAKLLAPGKAVLYPLSESAGVGLAVIFK